MIQFYNTSWVAEDAYNATATVDSRFPPEGGEFGEMSEYEYEAAVQNITGVLAVGKDVHEWVKEYTEGKGTELFKKKNGKKIEYEDYLEALDDLDHLISVCEMAKKVVKNAAKEDGWNTSCME